MTRIEELRARVSRGGDGHEVFRAIRELCALYESELARKDAALLAIRKYVAAAAHPATGG